jgi:hypothetical protein
MSVREVFKFEIEHQSEVYEILTPTIATFSM